MIEYYQREQKVHLREEARIEQDGAIVTGDSIDYFIAQELVKADSDDAREGNRVQVVIPPSMQQDLNLAPENQAPAADPDEAESVDGARQTPGSESAGEDAEGESGDLPADGE